MIGWLSGVLRAKQPPHLVLDVQGVGYELEAPMTTFYGLPPAGESVALFTHQVVREDAHLLYGFLGRPDRDLFRLLLRVSGIGPKLALAILSTMDAQAFARCVLAGEASGLTRVPGVGKKTAERLIIEMRDRLDGGTIPATTGVGSAGLELERPSDPEGEAVSALVTLGFKPQEASQRVRAVAREGMACEAIIRAALQSTVTRG